MRRKEGAVRRGLPTWLNAVLIAGAFGALVWFENKRPLRRKMESKTRRNARNLTVAALSAVTLRWLEQPVTKRLTGLVERRRWGLLKKRPLPAWLELTLSVVLLDYTLYLWHVAAHKVPLLWRFHEAHHVDLDLDASTAPLSFRGDGIFRTLAGGANRFDRGFPTRAFCLADRDVAGDSVSPFQHRDSIPDRAVAV